MFIDERIDLCARYGTGFSNGYSVQHHQDVAGNEYSRLLHPYPRLEYELSFANAEQDGLARRLKDLYDRCGGTFGAFRVHHYAEYTTKNYTEPQSALDQPLVYLGENRYQLVVWYGAASPTTPRRLVKKPVQGSVVIGVGGVQVSTGFTVDYATGIVTFAGAPGAAVTGGCEFDIPMRFAADYSGIFNSYKVISSTLSLIEVLNPS